MPNEELEKKVDEIKLYYDTIKENLMLKPEEIYDLCSEGDK